jgi:hypothetical protein
MPLLEAVVGPLAKLIDKIIPIPQARDRAKLELLKLQGDQEAQAIAARWKPSSPKPALPIPGPAVRGRASFTSCTR